MVATARRSDAFQAFSWEPKANRFRIRDGQGKGRFISRSAFDFQLSKYIRSQQQQLVGMADSLVDGAIDLPTFQRNAARTIGEIHASFALHHAEHLTNAEQKIILRRVQEQLYAGKDWQTGESYGIRSIAQSVKDGSVSSSQLRARLAAYAEAGRLTAAEVEVSIAKRQGKVYGIRKLGSSEHCPECPELQQLVPVAIDEIALIGDRCSCRVRCRCTIQPMTTDEAVQAGMRDPRKAEKRKRELEAIEKLSGRKRR